MATTASDERRTPLSTERIVERAVEIADDQGVAALSMRNLARALGFEVMALYNHVANKDELLSLMVDSVAAEIEAPPTDLAPLDAVRAIGISTHDTLVGHPWAPALWNRYLPGPARNELMETLLRLLAESGLSSELAHHGFHAVTNHVLGYTLQQLDMSLDEREQERLITAYLESTPVEKFPHMVAHVHQHMSGQTSSSFELVLDLILDGLVRLDEATG